VVWRHAFICLCHVLVCSIDDPAESGGVIVLWSIIWDRYACIKPYFVVVFLTEFTAPYSLNTQRGWHTSELWTTRSCMLKCRHYVISEGLYVMYLLLCCQ